ncbi:MAG: hypothetical protein WAM14_03885 [Candidatus Nitrosopolaris sp.]
MPDTIIKRIARVVPVLNGRDSDGKPKYLGPETTKIHRYLLVLWGAKSSPTLRLSKGVKEIDNSFYFTLYMLWKIAKSFKDVSPYHLSITYDRTKVAIKIYDMISNNGGLVTIKTIDGDQYVTTTKKGDNVSEELLPDLEAYVENDSEERFVAKGGTTRYDPELQKEERRRLTEKISEINLPFEDELKTIEDDIDDGEGDGDDKSQAE